MPAIVLIFSLLLPLFGEFGCQEKFEIFPNNGYIYIHVYDDSTEDDLSIEAKALLYSYIKKKRKIRGNFTIELSHMQAIKTYYCNDDYHEIYRVSQKNLKVIPPDETGESYRNIKEKIYYEIVAIENKEHKSIQEWYRLYNLYFSLGKIAKANAIMDKILQLQMKGF